MVTQIAHTDAHATLKRTRVTIYYDQDAESPIDRDSLGTLITYHRNGGAAINGEYQRDYNGIGGRRMVHEIMRGVSVAARAEFPQSWSDRDASGGFFYLTRAEIVAEYGACTAATRERANAYLAAAAREYRAYLDGDVWYYTAETLETCEHCGHESQTDIDSCGGFITPDPEHDLAEWIGEYLGTDDARAALRDALDHWTGEYPRAAVGYSVRTEEDD